MEKDMTVGRCVPSPAVLLVLGSDSDWDKMESCYKTLCSFGVFVDARICSAHRTPEAAAALAKNAEKDGFDVIIAAAGKAAHLPGVIAAHTPLPVVGVPIKTSALEGMDALLSIVQMPPGIPVATVAIDGSVNAAILALEMISVREPSFRAKIKEYKAKIAADVEKKDAAFRERIYKKL